MLTLKVRRILAETQQPVVLELGACDGRYTQAIFAACKHKPTIFSFEPDPRNLPKLKRAVQSLSGVHVVPAAVGNTTGVALFYLASPQPNGEIGSSSISPFKDQSKAFEWCKCEGTDYVPSWALDAFCTDRAIPFVDLIFMDIQGAERLMIEGAPETLRHTRYMWTEYEGRTIATEGTCYEHSSSLERLVELLPGWKVIEDTGGDALLLNTLSDNPHEPVEFIGV